SLVGPEGATNLSITLSTGMTGADLIGASLEGKDASGSPTHMRIDAVGVGAAPNQDLLYLNVSVEESGEWVHLCGAENGVPVPALPFPGKWNQDNGRWTNTTRKFSFACRGSAIAKCMEAGYKPWRQYELDSRTFNGSAKAGNGTAEGTITVYSNRDFEASGTKTRNGESRDFSRERTYPAPGADALQACVRMIRADYCGNGESHTVDGRIVDFWDNLGVHEQTHKEWTAEAIWGPEGASCFFSPRVSSGEKGYPSCVNKVRPDRFLCNVRQPHGVLGQILSNSYQAQARQ
ncbi:MAG: ADYC domain-containing protein, partial [Myxococcota bacterium]